jgi:hypothetical protein
MNLKQAIKGGGIALILAIMSLFPTYKNITNGAGLAQYENHKLFMARNSHDFDPWQYRILCPLLIEQLFPLIDGAVLDKISKKFQTIPVTEKATTFKELQKDPLLFKYTVVFVVFRFLEHLLIYCLLWYYLGLFTKNKVLISLFILMTSWAIGNAVMNSDLSLNTYMDIVLYLLAACVIVAKKNIYWIIPLSILGALNRETAAFIPFMLFFAHTDIKKKIVPQKNIWLVTSLSVALFFSILLSIRLYYGYRPETHTTWNSLRLNLFSSNSFYTYFEIFGAVGFLPFICLYYWRKNSHTLQTFFWLIVPIWFGVHLVGTLAREARCFLMPMIVVFMPMIVELIEEKYISNFKFQMPILRNTK